MTVLAVLLCLCVAAAVVLLGGREPAGPVSFPAGSLAPQGGALLGAWITPPGDFTNGYRYRWNTASFADSFKEFHTWGRAPASR